jgi:hypothetical protein
LSGGNGQHAGAADLHAGDAFVPTADDLAAAERELERFAAVLGTVELGTALVGLAGVVQPPRVVHHDVAAGSGLGAGADGGVHDPVGVRSVCGHGGLGSARGKQDDK